MREVISVNRSGLDLVLHLGDKCTDMFDVRNDFPDVAFIGVSGNCDYANPFNVPGENTFNFDGKNFYITHGHLQDVNMGIDVLKSKAKQYKSNIVLYGHTHVAKVTEENGVWYVNPGSLCLPRDSDFGSYAVIKIDNDKVAIDIVRLGDKK